MTSLMQKEIHEQIHLLDQCYTKNQSRLVEIGKIVRERNIQFIIYAARGSSDNAGIYFKYLCEVHAGLPVSFSAPSVITLYKGKPKFQNTLVIGVSQSGKAQDVYSVLEHAKSQGAITVSITNHEDSPLATLADFHLHLAMGLEESVAATKTFTAQLFLLGHLANQIALHDELERDLATVKEILKQTLTVENEIKRYANEYKDVESCFVLGRGYAYGIADELALKLQETSYIKAMAFATSDFHHGPLALASENQRFIVLAPEDSSLENSFEIVQKIQEVGAIPLIFSSSTGFPTQAVIKIPNAAPSVMVFPLIVASQLFSLYVSLAKGLNPDKPRGLKKVTITH